MDLRRFARIAACAGVAVALSVGIASPTEAGRKPRPTVDQTPPSQPTGLRVTAVTQTSVSLAWNPSTDNVGVMTYSLWGKASPG